MAAPTLIVFCGGMRGSAVEDLMGAALRAAALDGLEAALATGAFAGAVLVTDDASLRDEAPRLGPVTVDVDREPFHFGRRLAGVVERYRVQRALYFGAGAVPLLAPGDFAAVAGQLSRAERVVIANNFFSGDLVAFAPAPAIAAIELPAADNALPRLLRDAGLENQPLPRTTATQFNLDSPSDLAVLSLRGGAGSRLSRFVESACLDATAFRRCLPFFVDPRAEVIVAGRVGSQVWAYLEKETACRVRVFSEERGMQAAGADRPGGARSLLGYHLANVGVTRFFDDLATLGDAAIIDTRVLQAHAGRSPSREDRFLSDLGRHSEVRDPFLRGLAAGAAAAKIPVLLGGHSLVAGGLMALIEAAWRQHDASLG